MLPLQMDLIILIEPNVDAFGHADNKSSSDYVDRELPSGFQDHSGDAGTPQHAGDGQEQF